MGLISSPRSSEPFPIRTNPGNLYSFHMTLFERHKYVGEDSRDLADSALGKGVIYVGMEKCL